MSIGFKGHVYLERDMPLCLKDTSHEKKYVFFEESLENLFKPSSIPFLNIEFQISPFVLDSSVSSMRVQ